MPACQRGPSDKRAQAKAVGDDLIRHYGKQRFYTIKQVKDANRRQNIAIDCSCWSHAMFNSQPHFDDYHRSIGEQCDYASMKNEMFQAVSTGSDSALFDFDLSWLELPDIDWSIFDIFDL